MGIGGRQAVFLDRDGVINRAIVRGGKPFPPRALVELEILPDVLAALAALKRAGFLVLVVTNQPDVGRGAQLRSTVEQMHRALEARLPLDGVLVCYHSGDEECACRKPCPGLLLEAARDRGIDLAASYMIGDRWRDIDAGHHAGCTTILIDRGYQERRPTHPPEATATTLEAAIEWILDSKGGAASGAHP